MKLFCSILIMLFVIQNHTFSQELIQSIRFGDYEKAIKIIQSSQGLNEKDEDGNTPLHISASVLNSDLTKLLIDKGADVNSKNNYSDSPIFMAVNNFLNGDLKPMIELFLDNGVDINTKGNNGRTLLELLCLSGYTEDPEGKQNRILAEFLISKGANINEIGSYGSSFLTNAVYANKTEMIALSLENDPDINHSDSNGMSAFLYACSSGNDSIAKVLIEKKADINCTNTYGENCMTIAASYGHNKIISLMLKNGISVNLVNNISGETPLHKAAGMGYIDMVKLLLENGADVNAVDKNLYTPLKDAGNGNYQEIVELLKSFGGK